MNKLASEEATCANGAECAKRGTCLRWLDVVEDEQHPTASFFVKGDPACSGFIPVEGNG